jgi:blue light- and temperature-responsive anti-repressor
MLIHLIYASTATSEFSEQNLVELLKKSRANNAHHDITGMLLYNNGSFFQILEGPKDKVEQLFATVCADQQHSKVITIICEPIANRAFGDWTMGYATMSEQEVDEITGMNDFFSSGACFEQLDSGRAKKLLTAFKDGRWRAKIHTKTSIAPGKNSTQTMQPATMQAPQITFAFQPILDANSGEVIAYEAFPHNLDAPDKADILSSTDHENQLYFDSQSRALAISLAARLGLSRNLHLNFLAQYLDSTRADILYTLETAERNHIDPSRIVLEIGQEKLSDDVARFGKIIDEYRGEGLKISINQFGAGRAGLNLLEPYRPEMISLNEHLVRGIESNGPRQAIIRGLVQTCDDLGIDIIAKHIQTQSEYEWFKDEGINLFQGDLFAKPSLEQLLKATLPNR